MKIIYLHQVQYYETDQMQCVHHSNYIRWFEEARTRLLLEIGFDYAKMEEEGLLSPVLAVEAEYKRMARFGHTAQIEVWLEEYNGITATYAYTVQNVETGELYATGKTRHCFIQRNGKPIAVKKASSALDERFRRMIEEG